MRHAHATLPGRPRTRQRRAIAENDNGRTGVADWRPGAEDNIEYGIMQDAETNPELAARIERMTDDEWDSFCVGRVQLYKMRCKCHGDVVQ
jgi:hypothetical protein